MRLFRIVFLLLAAVLVLGDTAEAQQRRKTKINTVRVGFGSSGDKNVVVSDRGLFKAGSWTPVYVDLTAGEQGLSKAELIVESADSDDIPNNYSVPIPNLAPGEQVSVIGYTRPGAINPEIIVRVKEGNREIEEKETFTGAHPGDVIYLAVGARIGGLKRATAAKEPAQGNDNTDQGSDSRPGRYTGYEDEVSQLPTQWFGYAGVDLLILTTGNPDFVGKLLSPQENQRREALGEWVRRGGRLLLSIGRNHQVAPELFRRLGLNLPVTVVGPLPGVTRLEAVEEFVKRQGYDPPPLASLPAKDGKIPPIPLAKLAVQRGKEWEQKIPRRQHNSESPLMVRMPHGLGQVTVLAFDVDSPPFASWNGQTEFWNIVLKDLAPAPESRTGQGAVNSRRPGSGAEQVYDADLASQLQFNLEQMPEIPVISFGWVALFIFLYILVVGPLDYFFLKKVVGRLELTWITFPAVVLVVSAAAYFTAYKLKGNDQKINKIDVVDIDLGGGQVYGTTWFSIFSPRIQHYTIGVEPVSPVWSAAAPQASPPATITWMGRPDSSYGGFSRQRSPGLFRRAYDYETDASGLNGASGLTGVPIQVWSSKSFTASWERTLDSKQPPFLVDLRAGDVKSKELTGTITNQLGLKGAGGESVSLLDAALIYRGYLSETPNVYELGDMKPGVKVAVDPQKYVTVSTWLGKTMKANADGTVDDSARNPPVLKAQTVQATTPILLKKLLLNEGQNKVVSASLRYLDQRWRLEHRESAVLLARVEQTRGSAETVTENPLTPSRLWIGGLPGSGSRPGLSGELVQDTYVRVWIPISNPRAAND